MTSVKEFKMATKKPPSKVVDEILSRAHYLANQMIFSANDRKDKLKGHPKVGGHSSASASALHILGALHLFVKSGFDHICNKPHASPADHSFNYLLDLFLDSNLDRLSLEDCNTAMDGLRAFSRNGEPVFQSYHSQWDPDQHNFFPSGTVGIPPVNAGYLALAYSYAKKHGYNVPEAHFWSLIGDSEFREGSLFEAVPDFAEREIGNLTWIVDYNRQSLDGVRINNVSSFEGTDALRIEKTMKANGWDVIQLQHGSLRKNLFKTKEGKLFKNWLEKELSDYELQALLLVKNPKDLKKQILKDYKALKLFLKEVSDQDLHLALRDFGGHDTEQVIKALEDSKKNKNRPCIIISHSLKGWGLEMAAQSNNHSALPDRSEMEALQKKQGLETKFGRFAEGTPAQKFLKTRGEELYAEIKKQHEIKKVNKNSFLSEMKEFPKSLGINLKFASYPHTQWMLGQLTSKLSRLANSQKSSLKTDVETQWKLPSEFMVYMAPDVGSSTNLNPSMDGKVFQSLETEDYETEVGVKDLKIPDLVPGEEEHDRFLRFEIAEANTMSCMGSFGKMRDIIGVPLLPLMTVYDFFIKRAHDQYFYDLYWNSSFILCGTPAGVTLSPEGAQHGWKSDFQIPNQVTWEPFFCQELDWVFCQSLEKHFTYDNAEKNGALIRCVTRGVDQKLFLKHLKTQSRFKTSDELLHPKDQVLDNATEVGQVSNKSDEDILEVIRQEVLAGAYYLINYENYAGYNPGDNVVNIFSLGSLTTEAITASEKLLKKGVYANVIVVTSPDLLIGNLAHKNEYEHLRKNLNITSDLYLKPLSNGAALGGEVQTFSGSRVPIVSVHDGEPGLMDNIGSIVGTRHECLSVRKHSKCGTPEDIYKYHGIDFDSVVEAAGKVLAETALEQVQINTQKITETQMSPSTSWKELWS